MPQDRILREHCVRVGRTALLFLCALAVSLLIPGHSAVRDPLRRNMISLLEPAGWDSWMPVASTSSYIVFTATASIGNASPESVNGSASVTFHLSEVTSHEGRYMNDKTNRGDLDADIYFAPAIDQAELYGGKITWSGGGVNATTITASWEARPISSGDISVPVKVVCNDYAAYGKIHATLSLGATSKTHTIPRDINDNTLADIWDVVYYIWWYWVGRRETPISVFTREHLSQDRDEGGSVASGVNSGDGFTLFEEYRGFMVGGNHTRLHPEKKDVFLWSNMTNKIIEQAEKSIGYAYNLPMYVHQINDDEWTGEFSRVVNFCGGAAPQKAIQIVEHPTKWRDVLGATGPGCPCNPNTTYHCLIFTQEIERVVPSQHVDPVFRIVIAHEVGHAVGLDHDSIRFNPPAEGEEFGVVTFPTNPRDACVMNTGDWDVLSWDDIILWNGTGYARVHNSPPEEPDYEDHKYHYRLHTNHEGHPTYGDE